MKRLAILIAVVSFFLVRSGSAVGDELVFVASLTGAQEVVGKPPFLAPQPGVTTNSTGGFRIQFSPGLNLADFRLRIQQGFDVTQAHLHCAIAGVNGPVVAFLFGPLPDPGIDVNGLLSEGELTNASIVADVDCRPTCGRTVNNIASLRAAILDGCIYANVHSVAHPGGEIRGQLIAEPKL
jgi:CHRD domain